MTRIDYEPAKWGPAAWNFIHTVSFSYDEEPDETTRESFRSFFRSLKEVLPCAKCRKHFAAQLAAAEALRGGEDDPFRSRDALTRWVVDIHNQVNSRHRKASASFEEVKAEFTGRDMLCQSGAGGGAAASPAGGGAAASPAAPAPGGARRSRPRRPMTPSLVVLVVFVVVVLLFIAACVVAYAGCACKNSGRLARASGARGGGRKKCWGI